jgi:CDP-diacylglycerol--serine O-phosphatidyltransferase
MGYTPELKTDEEETAVSGRLQRHRLRKGLYIIPSLFTMANLGMGFYALLSMTNGFQLLNSGDPSKIAAADAVFDKAALAISWAILFDSLDGRIARMTKTATEFGLHLDSIADVVTFCLAPTLLAYTWGYGSGLPTDSKFYRLGLFISFIFLVCGALRLARFNVQSLRPAVLSKGTAKVDKKSFVGMPTPAAAGLIAAIVHYRRTPILQGDIYAELYSGLLMLLVGTLSLLMVSTFRFTSFKGVGTAKQNTRLVVILVAAAGMLLWLFSEYALLALWTGYALLGIVQSLFGLIRRRPAEPPRPD